MSTQNICNSELAAARWAKSLLELSYEENLTKEIVLQQLIDIVDTVNSSEDLKALFINPVVSSDEKQQVIERIFSQALSPVVKNFLLVLALRKRLGLLEKILEEYKKELNKCENIVRLTVTSAVDIAEDKRENLRQRIVEKLAKEADVRWKVDSSIIGGLSFDIDGTIIDDSLATKLNNLCRRIVTK